MNLFDDTTVLPGVFTNVISANDPGFDSSLFGTTDSVVIIGTAFNGPVGKEIKIFNPDYAEYIFGPVYDSKTRRKASLVAAIKDAWDRGCRTIYATRISGKDIYKDYQLAIDTDFKLRVSGIFPSNSNKDLSLLFDSDDEYDMKISIFKPARRATLLEKKQALIDSSDSVLVNTIDIYNNGLTKNDDLVELIDKVNRHPFNNVLRLSIVNEHGNDVTFASEEARSIKIGDMFPGLYTVGRAYNDENVLADTKVDIITDDKPYENFDKEFYKKLNLNTNVASQFPIYSIKHNMHEILGISSINEFDFLTVPEKIDNYFVKDKVDYEEVGLSNFELYKRLGSGYAINSMVEVKEIDDKKGHVKVRARVKEVTDKRIKVSGIKDGIYSMLQNLNTKYRVLADIGADTVIKGKLPKASEFKVAKEQDVKLFNNILSIKSLIDIKDLTAPKKYKFSFEKLSEEEEKEIVAINKKDLYTEKTIREVSLIKYDDLVANEKKYDEGSLFLCLETKDAVKFDGTSNMLYTFSNGKFQSLHKFSNKGEKDLLKDSLVLAGDQIYVCSNVVTSKENPAFTCTSYVLATADTLTDKTKQKKKYAVVSLQNNSFVVVKYDLQGERDAQKLKASVLGTVEQILSKEEDILVTQISSTYNDNAIIIKSNAFDFITIDELAEQLNNNKDFRKLFIVNTEDISKAQNYVEDYLEGGKNVGELEDKKIVYDTNKLIPFRTDDNFARQFAQHCMYTSIKTAPTHGVMGVQNLLDINLNNVRKKVQDLKDLSLDTKIKAKKDNGLDMLDANNMPYNLGRKLSIVVGQYPIYIDNYVYISNIAAGYAGMISCLPLDQSSTAQSIVIPNLMYEFTNNQLETLTRCGYVTIRKSYSKGWVITDGITMAPPMDAFKRLSSSRISDGIEDGIRKACEPFIGKQNHQVTQNSLKTSIKSFLEQVKGKIIEGYKFVVILDPKEEKLGIININYTIVPIYEIKEINNTIRVER